MLETKSIIMNPILTLKFAFFLAIEIWVKSSEEVFDRSFIKFLFYGLEKLGMFS